MVRFLTCPEPPDEAGNTGSGTHLLIGGHFLPVTGHNRAVFLLTDGGRGDIRAAQLFITLSPPEGLALPNADLGDKHLCEGCGAKFYDLKKTPPTCPACGVVHEPETKRKSRVAAAAPAAKKKPLVAKPKEEIDDDDDEIVVDDVEDIDDDDDDAADLLPDEDEDDDDLNDVGVKKPGGDDDDDS